MKSSFSTKFHSQLTVVCVTRGVHLGYIHNTMAKYKLPHWMAVFPLHIEPTAYDHYYGSSRFVLLWWYVQQVGEVSDRYVWCPYNGLLHPQLFTCNIYWPGVSFQDQHFLEDIMMYEEAHYRLIAFVSCWNRDRQMRYVWCPELLHPELCYTRTSNQRYVFIWDISLLINICVYCDLTILW